MIFLSMILLRQCDKAQHGQLLYPISSKSESARKYCGILEWEDREQGIFRVVKSEALAKMWGQRKKNDRMTYEKLSRALR